MLMLKMLVLTMLSFFLKKKRWIAIIYYKSILTFKNMIKPPSLRKGSYKISSVHLSIYLILGWCTAWPVLPHGEKVPV